jgi:hypothetical protein
MKASFALFSSMTSSASLSLRSSSDALHLRSAGASRLLVVPVLVFFVASPRTASACAVCFGEPESAQTLGANFAIVFLLGVTAVMLAAFASFFIYLKRRANAFAQTD